jgi:hypothetical protein
VFLRARRRSVTSRAKPRTTVPSMLRPRQLWSSRPPPLVHGPAPALAAGALRAAAGRRDPTAGWLAQASHGCKLLLQQRLVELREERRLAARTQLQAQRQQVTIRTPSAPSGTTQLSSSSLKLSTAGLITIARYMQWLAAPHVERGSVLAARWQLQTGGSCCTFEITTRLCMAYSRPCSKWERCASLTGITRYWRFDCGCESA